MRKSRFTDSQIMAVLKQAEHYRYTLKVKVSLLYKAANRCHN